MSRTRAFDAIRKARRALVSAHVNPDGDAVGSVLAMDGVLEKMGVERILYLESEVPAFFRFLGGSERIQHHLEGEGEIDLAIVLDCTDLSRVGDAASRIREIPSILNVDHHLYNTDFGTINLVDVGACATAAILFDLFREMEVELDRRIAESLYTGILTDTGSFRYENTSRVAFEAASELMEYGVDPARVAREVYLTMSLERLRLLSRALHSVECRGAGRIGVMVLERKDFEETGCDPSDTEGFVDYVRGIPGVEVGVLFKELKEGTVGVSLRSAGEANVAEIARRFGGGGHRKAAGFRLEGRVREHKERVLSEISTSIPASR